MKTIASINRMWEFISRVANVIVEIDNAKMEIEGFLKWLFGDPDDEPIKPDNPKENL